MSCYLLGVRIDTLTRAEAALRVHEYASVAGQHTIFTPNPEMLVKATRDVFFKEVLNRGDLNVCDGFGIRLFAPEKVERISGVDFMLDVCGLAENEARSIFFVGSGSEEVLKKVSAMLRARFPKLMIVGTHPGPTITEGVDGDLVIDASENASVVQTIKASAPAILFVAFGMGKQEKWTRKYLAELPSVRVAMGVGGAFDFLSGAVPRAPLLLRKCGLEWLYRLCRQPWRIKRILNATIVFVYYVFRYGRKSSNNRT